MTGMRTRRRLWSLGCRLCYHGLQQLPPPPPRGGWRPSPRAVSYGRAVWLAAACRGGLGLRVPRSGLCRASSCNFSGCVRQCPGGRTVRAGCIRGEGPRITGRARCGCVVPWVGRVCRGAWGSVGLASGVSPVTGAAGARASGRPGRACAVFRVRGVDPCRGARGRARWSSEGLLVGSGYRGAGAVQ